jgi:ABC-type glycerol-3-phosphate transport system permease component
MSFAVISSVPLLVVYIFSFRLLREGLTVGSVK